MIKPISAMLILSLTSTAATPLSKNDEAPFEGLLLGKEELAKLIADKQALEDNIKLDITHEYDKKILDKQLEIDTLKVDLKYIKLENDILNKSTQIKLDFYKSELEKRSEPYNEFWFSGGVIVGVGLMFLASYAYYNIDN